MLSLVPMLQTKDMDRTIAWYQSVLGFAVADRSNEGDWCYLTRDGAAIMFANIAEWGQPQATATQYFYTDDVMGWWNAIKDRFTAEWGPEEMPYGMLEFAIKDPNGYLLSFGQEIRS
ncbi:MAG TPA: VOC family protein [Hyphomicrobiales bacterium]|nr:VOC family protein [Hyphomicrobiales bacterium]